ncbi:MAG: monovalent cation/H+ antiporter subunit D family protein [Alphaproteobacteria bacterium]|nr:monovalent cation/H+ antiporter subunit D family protein [Alphaproteobacteria bacterium]
MSGVTTLLLAMAVPLAGALLIALSHGRPNQREAVTLVTAGVMFGLVASLVPEVLAGGRPATQPWSILPGLELRFTLEPLGMLFALVASSLWIVNSMYSIGYMRSNDEPRQTSFYVFFAVALAATLGIAFAGNLFTLFLFYELLTLSTYPLVVHKQNAEALRAGRTYLLLLIGSSIVFFLPAIVWVSWTAGTTTFTLGGVVSDVMTPDETGWLLALFAIGIGKAAIMPMHRWLPVAMVAPTPVSALLHAVAVVKAGVFSIVKITVYVIGVENLARVGSGDWLLYVAGTTVIVASLIALTQDNLKRRLAYSTVSQLSYVVLAAAILTPTSVIAAALHIAAHAFGKITLFFAAGSIYTAAHKTEVSELDGIGRRMPWTMGAFAVGALSMVGVPPAAGFTSKWYLASAALAAGQHFALAVIVLSTLLNAAYFVPIVYAAFLKPEPASGHGHAHGEAPWPMVLALVTTAAGTMLLFLVPNLPLALARQLAGLS